MAASSHPHPHRCDGLTVGDKCHDVADSSGILVVLEMTGIVAANYELVGGVSVANVHDDHPPHDEVVVCAYERDLETPGEADKYYYPESKLDVYTAGNWTEHEEGVDCEHCGETVPSTTDWVEHVVTDCPANPT